MPHGTRYMWDPGMVWLHVISDALIALAYSCIPMALIYFVRKRRDTPRGWVVWMFGAFIVSCGMTHVMEVWNIWHANYLLSGFVKAITAGFSVATAICLVRLIPQALLWPSPTTVETMNQKLQMEAEERARVKKELKQTEETLRLLLDGVKDHAIFMLDSEGRVVSWTSCATRLLGYQSNEIIGQHVSCLYSSADSESGKPALELEAAILNGRSEEIGQRKRKDGTLFWAEAMESPLFDDSGTLRGFAKVVRDITERKQTEHALVLQAEHVARASHALQVLNDELELRVSQRTAQLESSNQELEAFTYSVSHDLRAPLRHISGFSKLLVEDFGNRLEPEAKQYLERIIHGVRRMGILVDELLALAGVGRHKLSVEYANVNFLVNEVVTILTPETEGRLVEWKIGDLGFATCDAVLLAQVFQNLIGNALKFTRSRATAVIEIGRIEDAGQLTFFVRDNGVGFDMKYADKLFGVFQRLHRIEDFEGTGIGLATVRKIVQKHAGRTWAEAELGKGATFYFTMALPAEVQAKMNITTEEVRL